MKHLLKAVLLTCAGTSLAFAQGNVQGEKWSIKTTMEMAGMSMPVPASEVCKQPGDDSVPVKTEDNCQVYDAKRSGSTQSFKMRCTGKNAMEASGEFTYLGPDHYKGKMLATVDGESMTMNMEGKKIGKCDGGEVNLQAKKMQAQAETQMAAGAKMQADMCRKTAAEANSPYTMSTYCKDPADRAVFCSAVQTHDKFLSLSQVEKANNGSTAPGMRPLIESAQLCGFAVDAKRTQLCSTAEQSGNLKFVASECPVQATALAQAHCAGRSYTAISDKYRNFCAEFSSNEDRQTENTPASQSKGILNKSKKALGGLFGN